MIDHEWLPKDDDIRFAPRHILANSNFHLHSSFFSALKKERWFYTDPNMSVSIHWSTLSPFSFYWFEQSSTWPYLCQGFHSPLQKGRLINPLKRSFLFSIFHLHLSGTNYKILPSRVDQGISALVSRKTVLDSLPSYGFSLSNFKESPFCFSCCIGHLPLFEL